MPMPTMDYDPTSRLLLTPEDTDAPARARRLRQLGLGAEPRPELDEATRRLAALAETPYAMVTFVGARRQFFAGLTAPPGEPTARTLARDHGFCPHVVMRRRALVLEDVRDYARFAGNPLVDEAGVRSYLGAPLLDPSGLALGAVCALDRVPRVWGRSGLETIKATAADVTSRLLAAART